MPALRCYLRYSAAGYTIEPTIESPRTYNVHERYNEPTIEHNPKPFHTFFCVKTAYAAANIMTFWRFAAFLSGVFLKK
jgi:hypothetical protein